MKNDDWLAPGEEIVFKTGLHWFIYVGPILVVLLGVILTTHDEKNPQIGGIIIICLALFLLYRTYRRDRRTLYLLTNRRLILNNKEIRLNSCQGIIVRQSFWGRCFSYATIYITTGGMDTLYTYTRKPYKFKNAVSREIYKYDTI